jgi:hypothetical protein
MRAFFQVICGLAAATGALTLGWALTGRPSVDAARIGSSFQAVGAAVETYALLRIVWRPWVLPNTAKAKAAFERERSMMKRRLHQLFPSLFHPQAVELKLSDVVGTSDVAATIQVKRGGTLEERLARIEEDLSKHVHEMARWRDTLEDRIRRGHDTVAERLARTEATALRIRTDDAVRLLLGVVLSLIGATWASIG